MITGPDTGNSKSAIIAAVIGALAVVISACISVGLQKANVVMVNDNTELREKIAGLESRLSELERSSAAESPYNEEELSRISSEIEALNAAIQAQKESVQGLEASIKTQEEAVKALSNATETVAGAATTTPPTPAADMTPKPDSSQGIGVYTFLDKDFKDYGTITDNHGVSHEHSINNKKIDYYSYFPVNLDYRYKKLSGVLFQNGYYSASPVNSKLIITQDNRVRYGGTLLWEGEVNGSSDAKPFEVDVTGMRTIYFEIDNANTVDQMPAFFTAYLWK